MERYDVVIVGGGPAGTAAALEAARNGAEAVVLEKGVPRADRDGLGPDSTDAAGMLNYWVDIMGFSPAEIPDDVILQELNDAEFVGPNEACTLSSTGIESTYDGFGFTFHRARMDDWLRGEAEAAGAEYRVGTSVKDVETDLAGETTHTVRVADGTTLQAPALVLADGPQRTVTSRVLDRFLPEGEGLSDRLPSTRANHIAYQEHRRFPPELFDDDTITFWWGVMPGETAYPWVFPNDDDVARVGLTMPIGMDIDEVEDREKYPLLRPEDDRIPRGGEYIRRLLEREFGDEYDVETDFPLVEDRGKTGGTETYPISSTRPIDSPTGANVAVAGGAMGTTSAFHEGGYHVAVRSGRIAGELAAAGDLGAYNDAWKDAIGQEVRRNVAFADIVEDYGPDDWDRTFELVRKVTADGSPLSVTKLSGGLSTARLAAKYKRAKYKYRKDRLAQIREREYTV